MKKKEFLEILLKKKIKNENLPIDANDKENSLYLSTFVAIEKQIERLEKRIANFINFSILSKDKDKKYYILLEILYNEENYSNSGVKENFLLKLKKPSIENIPQEYNLHVKNKFSAANSSLIDKLTDSIENKLFDFCYVIDQKTLGYDTAEILYELSEQRKEYIATSKISLDKKLKNLNSYLLYLENYYNNNILKSMVEKINQKFIDEFEITPSQKVVCKFYKELKRLEFLNKLYEKNNIQEHLINTINDLDKKYPNIFTNSSLKSNGLLKIQYVRENLNKIFDEKELGVLNKISYDNINSLCEILFEDHSETKLYDYITIRAIIIEFYVLDDEKYKPLNKCSGYTVKTSVDKVISEEKVSEAYELYLQSKLGRGIYREFGIINLFEIMHKIDVIIDEICLELMKLKKVQDQNESLVVFKSLAREFEMLVKKCR